MWREKQKSRQPTENLNHATLSTPFPDRVCPPPPPSVAGHLTANFRNRASDLCHVTIDGQSVSQYVKVSSPLRDLWPDINFCLKVVVWKLSCLCRAPSLTRGRVCHLLFAVYANLSVFTSSIYVTCVLQFSNLYTKLHSVLSQYSRLCSASYY
jgi:hypothetical protein